MNLDRLRDVQDRERASDSLQELAPDFYESVAEYVRERKAERAERAAEVEDPFADETVQRLTDEIQSAEQVVEAIYRRRVGKLLRQASLAAAGDGAQLSGLTEEEQLLYDDLVERIAENKARVLETLESEPPASGDDAELERSTGGGRGGPERAAGGDDRPVPPEAPDGSDGEPAGSGTGGSAGGGPDDRGPADEASGGGGPTDDGPGNERPTDGGPGDERPTDGGPGDERPTDGGPGNDQPTDGGPKRTTVRVTRDVGEVFGVDGHVYTLAADDVVALPAENAEPLVERGAAEPVE